jgi:hypothetical protein
MARMVPFPMLPTSSFAERRLYEGFLEQLDDAYVVYHSVDWVLAGDDHPEEGEADFVLAHPGLGVLVLEVKGGAIAFDPVTRTWTQAGRGGVHRLDEDPFRQAEGEMHSLVRILESLPGWPSWRPSYGFGLVFPDARYERSAHPDAPSEIVVDRADLKHLAVRIPELMNHWLRPARRFGAEGMASLAQALGYRIEIRRPLRLRFDEEDKKIVELTDDQAWALAFVANRNRAAVTGPAGSGKTMLAVQVAKRVATRGHRTLLTCFTPRMSDQLRWLAGQTPNLDVEDVRRLSLRVAREAGLDVAGIEIEDPSTPGPVPADLLAEAGRRLGPRYDAIVVDQAQDFGEHWWHALLSLHRDPNDGRLYLFADDNRSLYQHRFPVPQEARIGPISRNLRSTRDISEFVSVFYEGEMKVTAIGPAGRPVEILGYEDGEGLVRLLGSVLENLIEEEQLPTEDVVILAPTGAIEHRLLERREAGGYRLSSEVEAGTILVMSVEAFEGMERPVVVLAGLGDEHVEDLRRHLYVGGSRARTHLIVLATEPVAQRVRELAGGGRS